MAGDFWINMYNVLMIGSKNIKGNSYGGLEALLRNYNALRKIGFVEYLNLYDYKIGKYKRRINFYLLGRHYILSKQNELHLLKICENKDIVCIEQSHFGKIAKIIKQKYPSKKVITFFQNCQYEYSKAENPFNLLRQKVVHFNEKCACKYSDKIIVLNKRDEDALYCLYKRKADAVIPISLENRSINFNKNKIENKPIALFLGSNFFANNHGLKWFIKNVLPYVDIKLKIVGNGMDKVDLPKSDKLEIIGYVENLEECMQNADFMIFPIFKGSGMKVKTCEALMHGKNIIGTGEAFMGYDVDFEKVGAKCETVEEFIKAINEFPQRFTNKFNEYSRSVFLEKYTDDVTFKQFAEMFE